MIQHPHSGIAALVLAKSLRDVEVRHLLAVLVTPDTVSKASISRLQSLYDEIIPVAAISGVSTDNLSIIGRPDLHATLTKLQLWALTQFSRVLYLNAYTLMLKNLDHLFGFLPPSVEFAASPELGFPDCFNAGLMFLTPCEGTYAELRQFTKLHESFDGGDQGILNAFFGDGSFSHPYKELLVDDRQINGIENGDGQAVKAQPTRNWYRLSFTYNIEIHKVYRYYVPAILRYKDKHKVLHFIGKDKP